MCDGTHIAPHRSLWLQLSLLRLIQLRARRSVAACRLCWFRRSAPSSSPARLNKFRSTRRWQSLSVSLSNRSRAVSSPGRSVCPPWLPPIPIGGMTHRMPLGMALHLGSRGTWPGRCKFWVTSTSTTFRSSRTFDLIGKTEPSLFAVIFTKCSGPITRTPRLLQTLALNRSAIAVISMT